MSDLTVSASHVAAPTRLKRSQSLPTLPSARTESAGSLRTPARPTTPQLTGPEAQQQVESQIDQRPPAQIRTISEAVARVHTQIGDKIAQKALQVQALDTHWEVSPKGRNQGLEHIVDYRLAPPPKSAWQLPREAVAHEPRLLDIYAHLTHPSTGPSTLAQLRAKQLPHQPAATPDNATPAAETFQPSAEQLRVFLTASLLVPAKNEQNQPRYAAVPRVSEISSELAQIQTDLSATGREFGQLRGNRARTEEQETRLTTLTQTRSGLEQRKKNLSTELEDFKLYEIAQETGKKNRVADLAAFTGTDLGDNPAASIIPVTEALNTQRQRGDAVRTPDEKRPEVRQVVIPPSEAGRSKLGVWETESLTPDGIPQTKMSSWYKVDR